MSDAITAAQQFWNALAEHDPLWAILSDPTRRGGRWDLETFFGTGAREISTLMHQLDGLPGGRQVDRTAALDFGCGVGRLTHALALYFDSVVGVDVSSVMIAHAQRLNRLPNRVTYVHNDRSDLQVLGDRRFNLIYTDLVLQHMPPEAAQGYLDEFLRLLAPQGLVVFQLPSHRRTAPPPLVVPMADTAYRAQLDVVDIPAVWSPGATSTVQVRVTNLSNIDWDQAAVGALRVGNHWLASNGMMLIQDDGRRRLPDVLQAGRAVELALEVTVPVQPGPFLFELDVVHEGHSWFADKGSRTLRMPVTTGVIDATEVTASTSASEPRWDDELLKSFLSSPLDDDCAFPMHGIPYEEVVAFLTAHGAELVLAENDDRGGNEWAGFRYFARRR